MNKDGSFLCLATLLMAAGSAPAEVKDHRIIIPPDGQCYHGVAVTMYDTFEKDFNEFQDAVGKQAAALHWFTSALNKQGKPLDWAGQQRGFFARCKELGRIPCANYAFKSDNGIFAGFDRYTKGGMDKQLQGMANLLVQYEDPVLLALNHEMNGNWYPWSADRKHSGEEAAVAGKNDAAPNASPEEVFRGYIESWRYVHRFLRNAGCKNVAFCFIVGAGAHTNTEKNLHPFTQYYPGDEYVDWLGFDAYNNTPPESVEKLIAQLEELAKGKPLMIKEWGTSAARARAYLGGKDNYPGDYNWVDEFFNIIERRPSIKAATYFHRGADYKITRAGGEDALKAYKRHIQKNRYLAKSVAPD